MIQAKKQKDKKMKKNKQSLKDQCLTTKQTNICIVGTQKEKRDRNKVERIFEEINAQNFPNVIKDVTIHM